VFRFVLDRDCFFSNRFIVSALSETGQKLWISWKRQYEPHLFVLEFLFGQVFAFSSSLFSLQGNLEVSQRLLFSAGSRLICKGMRIREEGKRD